MEFDEKRDEKPNLEWIEQKVDWTTTVDLVDWRGNQISSVANRWCILSQNSDGWQIFRIGECCLLEKKEQLMEEMTDCEGLTTEKRGDDEEHGKGEIR